MSTEQVERKTAIGIHITWPVELTTARASRCSFRRVSALVRGDVEDNYDGDDDEEDNDDEDDGMR